MLPVCCAGLSVESPLKAALTGLELVLARAQIWEESAAKHVSLEAQLQGVAALATRWRRLELAAWRNLLKTTQQRHAAGLPLSPCSSLHTSIYVRPSGKMLTMCLSSKAAWQSLQAASLVSMLCKTAWYIWTRASNLTGVYL